MKTPSGLGAYLVTAQSFTIRIGHLAQFNVGKGLTHQLTDLKRFKRKVDRITREVERVQLDHLLNGRFAALLALETGAQPRHNFVAHTA